MFPPWLVPAEDVARLKAARDQAAQRYNAALTALDAALPRVPELPHPPPGPDEHQVSPLNERWRVVPDETAAHGSWPTRTLRAAVWSVVGPVFERQQAFNSHLVDHVNRSVPVDRATRESVDASLRFVGGQLDELARFHSALIVYLQQVTPYVDTKDHELTGHARDLFVQLTTDLDTVNEQLSRRLASQNEWLTGLGQAVEGVGHGLTGVSDELLKRWESMVARERRYDAKVTSLTAAHATAHAELHSAVTVLQQSTLTLKREVERLSTTPLASVTPVPSTSTSIADAPATAVPAAAGPGTGPHTASSRLDSWKYVGFEDRFRGSQDEIRTRLEAYVPAFAGASEVLDVGCGRGEFLELLQGNGISARGLDLNHEMVEVCRARGLDVAEGDALGYVRSLPDGSLGGLFAAQVVEHLEPDYLLQLLEASYHALRPGSTIILETINPACWFAFFSSYIRDITHVQPLHPDTLSYLLVANGFQKVSVRYSAPYPEADKLKRVSGEGLVEEAVNYNVDKLNSLLFTYLDYAAVAVRG